MKNHKIGKTVVCLRQTTEKALVICGTLLFLATITAFAQDNPYATINPANNPAYVATIPNGPKPGVCVGFYDDICGAGYQKKIGWIVSDGSPVKIEESPSFQFVARKTGAATKITLGLSYLAGSNASTGMLIQDCGGAPCTTPDGKPASYVLCSGTVGHMLKFGNSNQATVSFKCDTQLTKGQPYWVLLQSLANSELVWNFSNSATGPMYEGDNDSWLNWGNQSMSAMTIQ